MLWTTTSIWGIIEKETNYQLNNIKNLLTSAIVDMITMNENHLIWACSADEATLKLSVILLKDFSFHFFFLLDISVIIILLNIMNLFSAIWCILCVCV